MLPDWGVMDTKQTTSHESKAADDMVHQQVKVVTSQSCTSKVLDVCIQVQGVGGIPLVFTSLSQLQFKFQPNISTLEGITDGMENATQ